MAETTNKRGEGWKFMAELHEKKNVLHSRIIMNKRGGGGSSWQNYMKKRRVTWQELS
jgi:hypothetical protein